MFLEFTRFVKPYWAKESIILVLMILGSLGTLVSPYILKLIIDEIIPSKDFSYLIHILIFLVFINIFRIVLDFYSTYLYAWVSNHIILDIRLELFDRILHYPLTYLDKNKTGDITHRINEEVNVVQGMITGSLIRIIRNILTAIGLTVALCLLNYKLFILSILVIPLTILNSMHFKPKIHNLIKLSREKDSDILSFFIEKFNNIKLIKIYNRYEYENLKLNSKGNELIGLNLKTVILSAGNQCITTFLISLSPIIILSLGGYNVITGVMTMGSLIAFIQYLNKIFNPINDFMNLYWDLVRSSVSMKRILEFLELPTESYNSKGSMQLDIMKKIEFKDVTFRYDGEIVLKNFQLELEQGKVYAIIGTSGSGKSTIINLLCKFYNVEKGIISVGGKNIDDINPNELREHIALVSQENHLFHDSIYENIRYGNLDCSKVELDRVSLLVGLEEYMCLFNGGENSIIGNEGAKLSGGQKQRIAIARALLRKADLIVLDEATSALDSESEYSIINNVSNHFKNKTIIIISHRLSAVKNADKIFCLDKGKVVEKGTHSNLIQMKGAYWELFRQQLEKV
jgi:ABC-type bacteriocin/lantibiotic exporter with double-glycine peptidase domain